MGATPRTCSKVLGNNVRLMDYGSECKDGGCSGCHVDHSESPALGASPAKNEGEDLKNNIIPISNDVELNAHISRAIPVDKDDVTSVPLKAQSEISRNRVARKQARRVAARVAKRLKTQIENELIDADMIAYNESVRDKGGVTDSGEVSKGIKGDVISGDDAAGVETVPGK